MKKHNSRGRRYGRRSYGMHEISLPPMAMGDIGSDFGDFSDAIPNEQLFAKDSLMEYAKMGAVGAIAVIGANVLVNAAGKVPALGKYISWVAPAIPIAGALAIEKYFGAKYPKLSNAVMGAAIGAAFYAILQKTGVFSSIGLSDLMGDDGLASDIYIPELVGLDNFPQYQPAYPTVPDNGVPQTAFLGLNEVVDEATDFESDLLSPGQEEDENYFPTNVLTNDGYEDSQGNGMTNDEYADSQGNMDEDAPDMLPI